MQSLEWRIVCSEWRDLLASKGKEDAVYNELSYGPFPSFPLCTKLNANTSPRIDSSTHQIPSLYRLGLLKYIRVGEKRQAFGGSSTLASHHYITSTWEVCTEIRFMSTSLLHLLTRNPNHSSLSNNVLHRENLISNHLCGVWRRRISVVEDIVRITYSGALHHEEEKLAKFKAMVP